MLSFNGPGGSQGIIQLLIITGKIEYTTMVINLYLLFTIKLGLKEKDQVILSFMLKK